MRFMAVVWKNLQRRALRSSLTCAGIALASAAVVALLGATRGFEASFLDLYQKRGADLVVQRGSGTIQLGNGVSEQLGKRIARFPEVRQVIGSLMDLVSFEKYDLFMVMVNGWPLDSPVLDRVQILSGRRLKAGDRRAVMLGKTLAANLGKGVGGQIGLYGKSFEVVGVFDSFSVYESGAVFVLLPELQVMIGRPGQVTGYVVKLHEQGNPQAIAEVKQRIEALDPAIKATPTAEFVSNISQIRVTRAAAKVISVIALVIGAIGVLNSLVMSVFERAREIGTLRALGWRKTRVATMIVYESLVLTLAGAVLGIVGGAILLRLIAWTPAWAGLIDGRLPLGVVLEVLVLAVATGLIGAVYPAWWAARLLPVEALRRT
jgi:putative ABC transport system permease protein